MQSKFDGPHWNGVELVANAFCDHKCPNWATKIKQRSRFLRTFDMMHTGDPEVTNSYGAHFRHKREARRTDVITSRGVVLLNNADTSIRLI